jgi:hypothetical protein
MTAPVNGISSRPTPSAVAAFGEKSSSCNVRVVARIRPIAQYELENGSKQVVKCLPSFGGLAADGPTTEPEVLEVQPPGLEKRWFELDAVFDGISTQQEVYVKSGAQQAVTHDIFKGFNCTILAYGQTGSGKTFTMGTAAGSTEDSDMDGVIPRACADLFRTIQQKCDGNAQVELSYMEIYKEEIRDLMTDNEKDHANLKVRETLNGEVYVSGLQSRPVITSQEIGDFMEEASKRRVTASTAMNAVSSRSHAICVLRIKGVLEDSTKFQAKLTLVDLAGSERIKKTGAEGNRRQEGININKGLFVLGQVVSALAEQRPKYKRKPPYRDSKLTRLLQDSLGGNSRTIMIACVSPADFNLEETVTTLRYATSARNIKNTATRNVIKSISPEEAAKLQRENQLLQAQVKELQETIQKMALDTTPSVASTDCSYSDDELERDDGDGDEHEHDSKSVRELEIEVKHLKTALGKSKGEIRQTMQEGAIELPELHMKVATLEEEVKAKIELEEENEALRQEVEEVKADAHSARLAASKLSKIMDQLSDLKGEEIDKKRMEYDHIKVEEAWVSFVFQMLETNKEQMRKLRDDFYLVVRVVESPEVMTLTTKAGKKWWQRGNQEGSGGSEMALNPEIRQQIMSETIQFFNEKIMDIENDIVAESESLDSIRESLREQRDGLEIDIGSSQFMKDSLNKEDTNLLEQLTALLIGPVKNLGDFN